MEAGTNNFVEIPSKLLLLPQANDNGTVCIIQRNKKLFFMSYRSYKYRYVIMYYGGEVVTDTIISDSILDARSDARSLAEKYSNGRRVIMVKVTRVIVY
jgi:hypothetical protein